MLIDEGPIMGMLDNIHWLGHASFKVTGPLTVYIDPWNVSETHDADIILVTHDHYDHLSLDDVDRVAKPDAVVVAPPGMGGKIGPTGLAFQPLGPGQAATVKGMTVEAVAAYNPAKPFHPSSNGWNGYVFTLEDTRIYHAGDSDLTPEMQSVTADIVLLPVGGKFTMDAGEAARAVQAIGPKAAIPMHWGSIVGSEDDARRFCSLVGGVGVIKPKESN